MQCLLPGAHRHIGSKWTECLLLLKGTKEAIVISKNVKKKKSTLPVIKKKLKCAAAVPEISKIIF